MSPLNQPDLSIKKKSLGERNALRLQCEQFSNDVDMYVKACYRYKKRSVTIGLSNTIGITRSPIDLYLRFKPQCGWPDDTLVIARIGFARTRKGQGTALMKFLADVGPRHGIRWIGIEETHGGENIQGFVQRFGFVNHVSKRNWVVSLCTLEEHLRTTPRS